MKPRIKSLDGWRGILCLLVVFHHYDSKYIPSYFFENFLIRQADLLVDFFFIISGFVMSFNYKHFNNLTDVGVFIKKRFLRLYPLLLFSSFLFFLFEIFSRNTFSNFIHKDIDNFSLIKSFVDTIFLNNSTSLLGNTWGINRPTWSISAEFYAYIVFSIILLIKAIKKRKLSWVIALVISAFILFTYSFQGEYTNAEFGFLRCIYLFIIGVIIEQLPPVKTKSYAFVEILLFTSSLCILYINKYLITSSIIQHCIELLIIPLLFSMIIYFTINGSGYISSVLSTKSIQWLGKYSYSIYLNHAIILLALPKFIFQVLGVPATSMIEYLVFLICILITIVYSTFTYKYVEKRFYKPNH